ncbi:MAG TPA: relaxase domain-containing protein [Trebonia sp.]|nr:relaxase domain-containing protein [Trebonia sp.]
MDARALYRMAVAASEYYNTAFETELTRRLGVLFEARADTRDRAEPVREVSGVTFGMIRHFSRRRVSIEVRYAELVRAYRREHGRDPARAVCHQLARQANLDTRQGKKPIRSLDQMRDAWRGSLTAVFGSKAVRQLMSAVPDQGGPVTDRRAPDSGEIEAAAEVVVASVAARRSTWTVWNLRAEAERVARERYSFGSLAEHRETVAAIVAAAISPRCSVSVEAPAWWMSRRRCGERTGSRCSPSMRPAGTPASQCWTLSSDWSAPPARRSPVVSQAPR